MKSYYFMNPLDLMPMHFDTLEGARAAATPYLAQEGFAGEEVMHVVIYEVTVAETVTL